MADFDEDFEMLAAALRRGIAGKSPACQAATRMLVRDGAHLRLPGFVSACVTTDEAGETVIDWAAARRFSGQRGISDADGTVLFLAGAIAVGALGLSFLDDRRRKLAAEAIAEAAEVTIRG
jgi:hypothetical protein